VSTTADWQERVEEETGGEGSVEFSTKYLRTPLSVVRMKEKLMKRGWRRSNTGFLALWGAQTKKLRGEKGAITEIWKGGREKLRNCAPEGLRKKKEKGHEVRFHPRSKKPFQRERERLAHLVALGGGKPFSAEGKKQEDWEKNKFRVWGNPAKRL